MSQVVTELVINADTAGASTFSQAMASAEQAANSGVASVAGFNGGLLALGAGAGAALVAVKGMMDYVVSANKGLADMQTLAHQTGLTLTDFQGIQFGGAIKGLSTEQINTGLEKSASLLNDASRNSNTLSKELEANGISIKNANGQLITENQLLVITGGLIRNAQNPGDQKAIAEMMGYTKEWIPFLEQAAGGISAITGEAKAAGVILDDDLIRKATDFDTEWRKSSLTVQANIKAMLLDLLPYVDDLILRADRFVTQMKNARPEVPTQLPFVDDNNPVDRVVRNVVRGGLNAVGINPDAGIEIKLAPEVTEGWSNFTGVLQQKFNDLQNNASDELKKQIEELDAWWHDKALDPAFFANAVPRALNMATGGAFPAVPVSVATFGAPIPPYARSDDPMNSGAYPKSTGPKDFAALQKQIDWADDAAGDAAGGGAYSKVAAKDVANDPVDRAINTLRRHTAQQEADTKAVGLGDAALAGYRATTAELAAVQANGGKETAAQTAEFAKQREAAIAAADALARAKVASSIEFGSKTAFLSSEDVAIANQLKGIYGNDVPAALDSTYAAAIKVNNAFKGISSAIESNLTTGLADITTGTKSVSQGFSDMSKSIIRAIEEMIIKITIVTPLMKALQMAAGPSGLNIAGLFSGGTAGAGATSTGAAGVGGLGGLYHTGGIVGSEPTSMRYVHPAHFNDAPKFHTGGIAGDEVPIIAKRGEGVFTPGQMAALGGGGGSSAPNIIINNHTDAQPQVSTGSNGDVTITLKKMVDGMVGDSLASGTGMRVLDKQYGVKQFAGQ